MGFCTGVLGITLIITNSKTVLEFMSHSSRGHFGVFWGLFWHISSNLLEPFDMFCEVLCRLFWCSFWGSLHYFFHIMTVLGALGDIFGLNLGNVYLILHNCLIFFHVTLYMCSWYNYDGHCNKNCFLYHVPRGSFSHIFLYFLRIIQYFLLEYFWFISEYFI